MSIFGNNTGRLFGQAAEPSNQNLFGERRSETTSFSSFEKPYQGENKNDG